MRATIEPQWILGDLAVPGGKLLTVGARDVLRFAEDRAADMSLDTSEHGDTVR